MAHQIDTPNAVVAMPAAGAVCTPGWFKDTDPAAITRLDADWCNMVQGELANIVTGFGGSLVKGTVNQISTALVEKVLTNGTFASSLYAVFDAGAPGLHRFRVYSSSGRAVVVADDIRVGPASEVWQRYDSGTGFGFLDADVAHFHQVLKIGGTSIAPNGSVDTSGNAILNNVTVGSKLNLKNAAVSEAADDEITVDWTSGGVDHACASAPATTNPAPNVSFIVKLNNASGATTINPGDAILVDLSGITATAQTLLAAHAEVVTLDPGIRETTVALRGLRLAAGLVLDSSGAQVLALTYVGRGNLTVAATTQGQAFIRVRLQYAVLTATT